MAKSLLFLLLSFLLASSLTSASKQIPDDMGMPGGWYPIENISDPHVQDLGAFAVKEHDIDEKDDLVFLQVVNGTQQVVAGMNYKLVLEAKNDDGVVAQYVAIVWEKSWEGFKQLISFCP